MFELLTGECADTVRPPATWVERADDPATLAEYHALRRQVFVDEQGLFRGDDRDDRDADPRTVVLVARDSDGTVIGGVRLGPAVDGPDIGWWGGGRLAVHPAARRSRHGTFGAAVSGNGPSCRPGPRAATAPASGIGAALVRAACAQAEQGGALRFEATVQPHAETFFRRLGWRRVRPVTEAGVPHVLMRWPTGRLAAACSGKAPLGGLLAGLSEGRPGPGGLGFVGDDGAPVPGSDLVVACDAIIPSMVERDPGWAGWCSVLVNVNDLAAMGAAPVGLLDALGARDASFAARILTGLRSASAAYQVPVLGGHTQLGVPAALSVTAVGRAADPVPGGGGRPAQRVRVTADVAGSWRVGYRGQQWDSTTGRRSAELRTMLASVAAARPAAAKDVSMAGIVGTLGMLAESSGCAAVLDVANVPRPDAVTVADWLTCFPGFAMVTAADADGEPLPAAPAVSRECGELRAGRGVSLRWPDGDCTEALDGAVTGLGPA